MNPTTILSASLSSSASLPLCFVCPNIRAGMSSKVECGARGAGGLLGRNHAITETNTCTNRCAGRKLSNKTGSEKKRVTLNGDEECTLCSRRR